MPVLFQASVGREWTCGGRFRKAIGLWQNAPFHSTPKNRMAYQGRFRNAWGLWQDVPLYDLVPDRTLQAVQRTCLEKVLCSLTGSQILQRVFYGRIRPECQEEDWMMYGCLDSATKQTISQPRTAKGSAVIAIPVHLTLQIHRVVSSCAFGICWQIQCGCEWTSDTHQQHRRADKSEMGFL